MKLAKAFRGVCGVIWGEDIWHLGWDLANFRIPCTVECDEWNDGIPIGTMI